MIYIVVLIELIRMICVSLKTNRRNSSATLRTISVHWSTLQTSTRLGRRRVLVLSHPFPSITLWILVRKVWQFTLETHWVDPWSGAIRIQNGLLWGRVYRWIF